MERRDSSVTPEAPPIEGDDNIVRCRQEMRRPQPQDGAGWARFPELEPTQGHFPSLRAMGVTRHTIVPAVARPVFRILSTGKKFRNHVSTCRQIAIWNV